MSSIPDFATLTSRLGAPTQLMQYVKNAGLATGAHLNSWWLDPAVPAAGVAPSGGASIPDRTTAGALGQLNKSGANNQRAWLQRFSILASSTSFFGTLLLVDRLAHKGGLDGTLLTAQTVSTPALTRSTDGVNVWAAAEIYTAIGTTGSTLSASYTNQAGTAARTSQAINFGVTNFATARCVLPLSMQSGDKGVKSVETCTLASSSGTAGNFGITLFKTLGVWANFNMIQSPQSGRPLPFFGTLCDIPDNACLQILAFGSAGNTAFGAVIDLFED